MSFNPKEEPLQASVIPIDSKRNEKVDPELKSLFLQLTGFRERADFLLSPTRFDQIEVPSKEHETIRTGRELASAILGRPIKFTGPVVMKELADKLGF